MRKESGLGGVPRTLTARARARAQREAIRGASDAAITVLRVDTIIMAKQSGARPPRNLVPTQLCCRRTRAADSCLAFMSPRRRIFCVKEPGLRGELTSRGYWCF